eukprot:SAG31_NODE_9702_length_1240_cov_1.219982_2_plen_58_part_00
MCAPIIPGLIERVPHPAGARAQVATVGGGRQNVAAGAGATVPGGQSNSAAADGEISL